MLDDRTGGELLVVTICRPFFLQALVIAVIACFWLPPAPACQICFPIPKNSTADFLLSADRVVLACENPDKPFSLMTVEVLKGSEDGPEIDLFLDSGTRRLLKACPERHVVCVYRASSPDAPWLRVGVTNDIFAPIVREILHQSSLWETKPKERLAYFSQFLGHEDSQLSSLAHIEVARAPYHEIRGLGNILPRKELHAFLGNFRMIEWHPLYLLLLGQSEDEQDHEIIVGKVRSAEKFATSTQLASLATAWIEMEQGVALDFFEANYLSQPDRSEKEMRALLMALSVHGTNGHVHLRDRIVDCYRMVLSSHPSLALQIVTDLNTWKRQDLVPEVAAILASPPPALELSAIAQLRSYLRASDEPEPEITPKGFNSGLVTLLVLLALIPIGLAVSKKIRGGGSR